MKKVHRFMPDVPQKVADRGTEAVERLLVAYGVSRASDLPEEGKVRLMREMRGFFAQEFPDGVQMLDPREVGWRGFLRRAWRGLARRGRRASV